MSKLVESTLGTLRVAVAANGTAAIRANEAAELLARIERLESLLREVRPTIPREVLELWCKDRDDAISATQTQDGGGV